MPAWGNHEWENPATDDLRNYKGRFVLPECPQHLAGAPAPGVLRRGLELVRRRRRPVHLVPGAVLEQRRGRAGRPPSTPVFAAAQADPSIHFIVTFGHRPAYSTGFHDGEATLAACPEHFRRSVPEVRPEPQRALARLRALPCRSTESPTSRPPAAARQPRDAVVGRPTHGRPSGRCTSRTSASTSPSTGHAASRPCAGRRR